MVLRGYSGFCSRISPGVLGEFYGMSGMESVSTLCKARALPTVLSPNPHCACLRVFRRTSTSSPTLSMQSDQLSETEFDSNAA